VELPKEGSNYDLPIALGLMAAIGAIPHDALGGYTVLGELGLGRQNDLPIIQVPRGNL
jgi:magnesium chelatase family protein